MHEYIYQLYVRNILLSPKPEADSLDVLEVSYAGGQVVLTLLGSVSSVELLSAPDDAAAQALIEAVITQAHQEQ